MRSRWLRTDGSILLLIQHSNRQSRELISWSHIVRLHLIGSVFALAACAAGSNGPLESFDNRADLQVLYLDGNINGGVSNNISFDVPPGVESLLIEVRGGKGRYYLTKFVTPSGRDLIEASQFVTRGARELPGLVTWMYPNVPDERPAPGQYELLIRAEDGEGGHISSEYLDIRVYLEREGSSFGCGLNLDILVADDAIVASDVNDMVQLLIDDLSARYAPAGVRILDHTASSVVLPTADLDLGGNPAIVISQVEDVMDAARADGRINPQSIHVLIVRSLGADLRGYSMGLPGPMGSDLATSAVLVSSRAFVDNEGFLDVYGLAETTAHELGHYLGLYHTSEFDGQFHDPIEDTPQCTDSSCPAQYWNNLMTPGSSNRTVVTPGQAEVIRNHPLCVPTDNVPTGGSDCSNQSCQAPYTCALIDDTAVCAFACDPNGAPCPNGGACKIDGQGKYVCSSASG